MKQTAAFLVAFLLSASGLFAQTTIRATDPVTGITTNVGDSTDQALRVASAQLTPQVITGNFSGTTPVVMVYAQPSPSTIVFINDAGHAIAAGMHIALQGSMDGVTYTSLWFEKVSTSSGGFGGSEVTNDIFSNSGFQDWGQYVASTGGMTHFRLNPYNNPGGESQGYRIVAYPFTVSRNAVYLTGANGGIVPTGGDNTLKVSVTNGIQLVAYGNGDSAGNNDLRVTVAADSTGQVRITDGTTQATVKAASTAAAATDKALVVAVSPNNTVPVSAASLPLPTGASTSANQAAGNTSLASIDTKTPSLGQALAAASVPVVLPTAQITALTPPTTVTVQQATGTNLHAVTDTGSTTAVTGNVAVTNAGLTNLDVALSTRTKPSDQQHAIIDSGTTVVTQPTGSNLHVACDSGCSAGAPGQATMAASSPVVIASDQSAVPVSGTVTTTPPANATTNVTQFGGTNVSTGTGTGGVGIPRVTVSSDSFPTTQAVSATSLPLPSGASTSALQTTGNTSVASIDGKTPALGQTTMSASSPVTIASNQSAVPVTLTSTTITGNVAVTGPLTDAQLRNTAVPTSVADGANATQGDTFDTAWLGGLSGGSIVSVLKAVANNTELPGSTIFNGGDAANGTSPGVRILGTSNDLTSIYAPFPLGPSGRSVIVEGNASGVAIPTSVSSLPLPTGASTSSLQSTGNTSLATIAGAVTSAVVQENLKQVNGVTTLTGTGATGTGAQRVTVAVDSATVAGSASLPAGANVIGHVIADSGSTTTVTGTVTLAANQSVNLNQVGGASFALGQQLAASSLPVVLTAAQLSTLTPLSTVAVTNAGLTNLDVALSTRTKPADQQHTIIDSGTTVVTQPTGSNLHVQCDSGCSSSADFADNAAFTFGTTAVTPIAGVLDDVSTNVATENSAAIARITPQKGLHINLRNQAGTEIGTPTTPVQVSLANTGANTSKILVTPDPVTDTTASASLAAINDAITIALAGKRGALATASTFFGGNVTTEFSSDGGATYLTTGVYVREVAAKAFTIGAGFPDATGTARVWEIYTPPGATHVRIRVTSGSTASTFRLTATDVEGLFPPTVGWNGVVQNGSVPAIRMGLFDSLTSTDHAWSNGNGAAANAGRVTIATDNTGPVKLWDGTNTSVVKAASTAAIAADAALVVAVSPNNSVAVTQATGTNLHAVIDTGSTTAVTQATGTNLHTVVDSGTTTVTQATGTNLHAVIDAGSAVIGALTANQSVNHAQINGVTVSTGNGVPDTGTQRVFSAQRRTYSASTTAKTATAAGTAPFFALCGSASQTVRVQKVLLSGTVATAAIYGDVVLKKTSTATSSGTATTLTAAPHDSNSAAATATVKYYTVLATAGSSVGVVQAQSAVFPLTGTVAASMTQLSFLDMNRDPVEAIVLRGVAQCLEMSFGTTPTNAPTLAVSATWTEE